MGVTLSKCVNLAGQEAYLAEPYTVVRTSGEQQTGFLLTEKIHRCYNTAGSVRPTAHALLKETGWSVHLHNGDQSEETPDAHCCGWRRLGTFWPTRLAGDQCAIDAWTTGLRHTLERLASEQGLPEFYQRHTCNIGAPAAFCDGCIANDRAQKKKEFLDERNALLEAAEPNAARLAQLEYKLAKLQVYSAAYNRAWTAWRAAQNAVEAAEVDYRNACISRSCESHDGLREELETLKARADELRPAAFPPEPEEPPAEPAPPAAKPRDPPLFTAPLPEPMNLSTRRLALGSYEAPEVPTMHGCAYADSDCPWAICYACESEKLAQAGMRADGSLACEYEKNPTQYKQKIRHSELIQIISAYWRDPRKGERAKGWRNEDLEAIVAFLDTPRADRPYTDEQIADSSFVAGGCDMALVGGLRQLMTV
jgi:hypothetical protein